MARIFRLVEKEQIPFSAFRHSLRAVRIVLLIASLFLFWKKFQFFKKYFHSLTEKYLSKWISFVFNKIFPYGELSEQKKNMGVSIIAWTNMDSL